MTTPPPPVTNAEAALIVGAVSMYAKAAKAADDTARKILAQSYMSEGDRTVIRDPRDRTKLGTVSVSDPKRVAEVDDEAALLAYIAEQHPYGVDVFPELVDDSTPIREEAYAVLREHAPHLLADRTVARDWARKQVLDAAVASGDPIPGVSLRMKRGVVSVRPADGSAERYRELVAGGHVDPLRELPAVRDEQSGAA